MSARGLDLMCGPPSTAFLPSVLGEQKDVIVGWRPEALPATSGCDSSDCSYCQALARLRRPGAASAAASSGCWLRRKRSRTELPTLAEHTPCSSCGAGEDEGEGEGQRSPTNSFFLRVPSTGTLSAAAGAPGSSMWDHALLADEMEEEHVWQMGLSAASSSINLCGAAGGDAASGSGSSSTQHPSASLAGSVCGSKSCGSGGNVSWEWRPSWQAPAALEELTTFDPPAPHGVRHAAGGTDIVCALEFEEHGWLLASAGVSKQVRIYTLASRLQHPDSPSYLYPIRCHRMPSKLSSLAWNPDSPGVVTVADYDGVVAQVDMESGHLVAEADEHCGRRVWSVSHSLQRPHLCASASDDGTVRLWGGDAMQCCLAVLRPGGAGAPATGVHLSPFDGDLLAVSSADHNAYVYDLRRADKPLLQLSGHARAVSYVRWLGPARLATASTDASVALWQLPGSCQAADAAAAGSHAAQAAGAGTTPGLSGSHAAQAAAAGTMPGPSGTTLLAQPCKRLRGHRNSKNFCGLAVRPEEGLVACGSEAPAAYAYHESWAAPLAVHRFASGGGGSSSSSSGSSGGEHCAAAPAQRAPQQAQPELFCSAVAWQPAVARPGGGPLLVSALSNGQLRVLEMRRPTVEAAELCCADA